MVTTTHRIYEAGFRDHRRLLDAVEENCSSELSCVARFCSEALSAGGKLLFFGNGGSAADAQHLAAEFAVRFVGDRRALAGLALTTDTSVITACGNDLGFDNLFARQIHALGRPGDVAVGLTTSGNSPNIVLGFGAARELGLRTVAFTGEGGGTAASLVDHLIAVPSRTTARIQEMHILLGHLLCADIEHQLGVYA